MPASGTSPHLRGNLHREPERVAEDGDIPAPAGQPHPGRRAWKTRTGHPRTCGATLVALAVLAGTSPHLRGNHPRRVEDPGRDRDIPAPAGQPRTCRSGRSQRRGHPRTCGATPHATWPAQQAGGTSPHLRGNRLFCCRIGPYPGDIPAPAGQPSSGPSAARNRPGHPRTCGATHHGRQHRPEQQGTSPHLRGNHPVMDVKERGLRDIPAPAGQPMCTVVPPHTRGGHPRTCGATSLPTPMTAHCPGTSPHLRGNRTLENAAAPIPGDIPAPAGQPAWRTRGQLPRRGHPRTCGATHESAVGVVAGKGTSPHLRGNLIPTRLNTGLIGDIPAPAGQP